MLAFFLLTTGQQAFANTTGKKQPVIGILRDPVVGLGSETTGIAVETSTDSRELILSKDFKENLVGFDGRLVEIQGRETTLSGVETKNRPAIKVSAITLFPRLQKRTGILIAVAAIGGETSGYELDSDDSSENIEIIYTPSQEADLKKLVDQKVKITGKQTTIKGTETPEHPGIYLETALAAD